MYALLRCIAGGKYKLTVVSLASWKILFQPYVHPFSCLSIFIFNKWERLEKSFNFCKCNFKAIFNLLQPKSWDGTYQKINGPLKHVSGKDDCWEVKDAIRDKIVVCGLTEAIYHLKGAMIQFEIAHAQFSFCIILRSNNMCHYNFFLLFNFTKLSIVFSYCF